MISLFKSGLLLALIALQVALMRAQVKLVTTYHFDSTFMLDYRGVNILACNITGVDDPNEYFIKWYKAGNEIASSSGDKHIELRDNKLYIRKATDDDIMTYSCAVFKKDEPKTRLMQLEINTIGKASAKLPPQLTVTEGEKLKLECIVTGKPTPTVEWRFDNQVIDLNNERIHINDSIEKGVAGAFLEIDNTEMSDRGEYSCSATIMQVRDFNTTNVATSFVRVKDKLAALWPFIGICAEVIVLCAIIFIYERKRNKAELDESDTDQSPEQKNTPDHAKDSVRQRK